VDDTVQKLFLMYKMTIKAGNVYFTTTSQIPIENSANPIFATTSQATLPLNICKITVYRYIFTATKH
jgi:hypothetical protein